MSNGPGQIGDSWYLWGQGADGDALVLQSTGVTLGGLTLFRIVAGTASSESAAALLDDETGNNLVDDATGQLLHDG